MKCIKYIIFLLTLQKQPLKGSTGLTQLATAEVTDNKLPDEIGHSLLTRDVDLGLSSLADKATAPFYRQTQLQYDPQITNDIKRPFS